MAIKHKKVFAVADSANTGVLRPSDWHDEHVLDDAGIDITIASTAKDDPADAAFGKIHLRKNAGRHEAYVSNAASAYLRREYPQRLDFIPSSTSSVSIVGCQSTISGNIQTFTYNAGNSSQLDMSTPAKKSFRVAYTGAAGVGSVGYVFLNSTAVIGKPNALTDGGFFARILASPVCQVGVNPPVTGRFIMGIAPSFAALNDVAISTEIGHFGVGYDSNDSTLSLYYADETSAPTKIAIPTMPRPSVDRADLYELKLFSPNSIDRLVNWELTNLKDMTTASGVVTTNLPISTRFINLRIKHSNGGGSSSNQCGVSIGRSWMEWS